MHKLWYCEGRRFKDAESKLQKKNLQKMDMSSRFCMDLRYSKHTSINFLNGFLVIFCPFRHIHFMGYLPIVVATVVNRVLFMHLCKLDWANLHIWLNRFYGIIVGWCWCSWNEGKMAEKFEECSTIIIILMWYTRVNSLSSHTAWL